MLLGNIIPLSHLLDCINQELASLLIFAKFNLNKVCKNDNGIS